MRVNIVNGGVMCHGCRIKGSGYDIIMEIENCDFKTAKEKVGVVTAYVEGEFII